MDKSDNDRDCPHDYVELSEPLRTRYLRFESVHVPTGHVALSGFRVFGNGDGPAPETVKGLRVERDRNDRRNALISWKPVEGAYGYNLYYGTEPGKLYNCITVLGTDSYDFRGLDRDTDYCFAIEALSENGRSPLSPVVSR